MNKPIVRPFEWGDSRELCTRNAGLDRGLSCTLPAGMSYKPQTRAENHIINRHDGNIGSNVWPILPFPGYGHPYHRVSV